MVLNTIINQVINEIRLIDRFSFDPDFETLSPEKIKSIESYAEFHSALEALPAPQAVKDAIKPRLVPAKETVAEPVEQEPEAEPKGIIAKGKGFFKKAGDAIGDTFADLGAKAMVFSEENFKNKKKSLNASAKQKKQDC